MVNQDGHLGVGEDVADAAQCGQGAAPFGFGVQDGIDAPAVAIAGEAEGDDVGASGGVGGGEVGDGGGGEAGELGRR